ncbi:hypothetical protein [Streptomyces sp. SS]|uniref:hypothetical protein n=1 Tax=Streptomyces sp. SS TaxID=260742 RepID=UPI0003642AC1|nr:hypothetical protein [Streptomyces sp. SS]
MPRVDEERGRGAAGARVAAEEGVGVGDLALPVGADPDALPGLLGEGAHGGGDAVPGAVAGAVGAELFGDGGEGLTVGRGGLADLAASLAQGEPGGGGGGGDGDEQDEGEDAEAEAHARAPPSERR